MNRVCSILGLVFALTACARSTDETTVAVTYRLLSNASCPSLYKRPTARLITGQHEYRKVMPLARSLGGNADDTIDFSQHDVLLLSMGEKPTAGYSLKPAPPALGLQNDKLLLNVQWKVPRAAAAQVMTYPCLLLLIEKSPARFLLVKDQQGHVLLNTKLR